MKPSGVIIRGLLVVVIGALLLFSVIWIKTQEGKVSCEEAAKLIRNREIRVGAIFLGHEFVSMTLKDGRTVHVPNTEAESCDLDSVISNYYAELNENCSKPGGKWEGEDCPQTFFGPMIE